MDEYNVIELKTNIPDLDNEMNAWLQLSFDNRKRSDDVSIQRYGMTNTDRYNSLKSALLSQEKLDTPLKMEGGFIVNGNTKDLTTNMNYNNIQSSRLIQISNPNIVLIDDFLDDNSPDYNMDDLLATYVKYLGLNNTHKMYSDDYSMSIYNKSVPEMFTYMKAKIQKVSDVGIDNSSTNKSDTDIISYQAEMQNDINQNDNLSFTIRAIDSLSSIGKSKYESTILETVVNQLSNTIEKDADYTKSVSKVTPFLSPDEYDKTVSGDTKIVVPFDYINISDPDKYMNIIHDYQNMLNDPSKRKIAEEKLLSLGWNPYVPATMESFEYARKKQIKWLNTNENCRILNLSKFTSKLDWSQINEDVFEESKQVKPVYIIIANINGSIRCGISFTPELGDIYSINHSNDFPPIVKESMSDYTYAGDETEFGVYTFFVDPSIEEEMNTKIEEYLTKQNSTAYMELNHIARVNIPDSFNMIYSANAVCIQIIDFLINLVNLTVDQKGNIVPLNRISRMDHTMIYLLYYGFIAGYDFREITLKTAALEKQNDSQSSINIEEDKIYDYLSKNLVENFNISINGNGNHIKQMNQYIYEAKQLLKAPKSVYYLSEMKFPIGFNKKGDFYFALPKNLQNEYNEAHRLLQMYDETNIEAIKHELARLYYINYLIEKKMKKVTPKSLEYKEFLDLRARVLNDFSTYFKIVKTNDPKFDFTEYMKDSEFYTKSMVIDTDTMKGTGNMIKKVFQFIKK